MKLFFPHPLRDSIAEPVDYYLTEIEPTPMRQKREGLKQDWLFNGEEKLVRKEANKSP